MIERHVPKRVGPWLSRQRWLLSLLLVAALWQGATWAFDVPRTLLPSPAVTVQAIVEDADLLAKHTVMTLLATVSG